MPAVACRSKKQPKFPWAEKTYKRDSDEKSIKWDIGSIDNADIQLDDKISIEIQATTGANNSDNGDAISVENIENQFQPEQSLN